MSQSLIQSFFDYAFPMFRPKYKRIPHEIFATKVKGKSHESAVLEVFTRYYALGFKISDILGELTPDEEEMVSRNIVLDEKNNTAVRKKEKEVAHEH